MSARLAKRSRPLLLARGVVAMLIVVGSLLAMASTAASKVFHARDELFALAFPDADEVVAKDFFLTPAERTAIEERAKSELDSDLLTVYVGKRAGEIIGYAFVDTHIVRTLPETFLVVLDPAGKVTATHVLAFYEPLEYLPSHRWLAELQGQSLHDALRVGGEIAAITGSTLSSRAVVGGARRALAAYEVLLTTCDSSSPENGHAIACSR